jgi:putative iron-regulated protein
LSTTLLVGGTGLHDMANARQTTETDIAPARADVRTASPAAVLVAQAEASGEGGPGEGGGSVLGTITEFRLANNDPNAFGYDASRQISAYADLVSRTYMAARDAASNLKTAIDTLRHSPSVATLKEAKAAWLAARADYLLSEAFLFYGGPVDGPEGPLPRLNGWPVDPAVIEGLIAEPSQALDFRSLARLNKAEAPVKITTGLHVLEFLLWGADGEAAAADFEGPLGSRRGEYAASVARLLSNDLGLLAAAWSPGNNNYRASLNSMDKRNAMGRAFNGMAVLVGYELPLRRIGAGLFPANRNFQPSPFSGTSELDNRTSFEGARLVYFESGLDRLVDATDAALAKKLTDGFERAETALAAMDAPYQRFLTPAPRSAERATAEAAARSLTDLAADLRQAANRLGVLVVIPGM